MKAPKSTNLRPPPPTSTEIKNIHDVHWHDSVIRKVIEFPDPDQDKLLIEINYPVDWYNEKYEIYTVQFRDIHGYEIHEGACAGAPVIMNATELDEIWKNHDVLTIRIETTHGYRIVRCNSLSLEKGEAVL